MLLGGVLVCHIPMNPPMNDRRFRAPSGATDCSVRHQRTGDEAATNDHDEVGMNPIFELLLSIGKLSSA